MTAPRVSEFPNIGFVPCPGDSDAVSRIVNTLNNTAKALEEIQSALHGTGKGNWKGKAADSFRTSLEDEFRPMIDDAYSSFNQAKKALSSWVSQMRLYQGRARSLEKQAAEVEKADDNSGKSEKHSKSSGSEDDDALKGLRERAQKLRAEYQENGRKVAQQLKSATEKAPSEPGFWDKVGDLVSDIGKLIRENADWIGVLAAALGVAAIFFPALALAAFALSAVAFSSHLVKFAEAGELWPPWDNVGSYLTLGGDALGAVPGIGVAIKGAKVGASAARGAQGLASSTKVGLTSGLKAAQSVSRGINPAIRGITTPVEALAKGMGVSGSRAIDIADGVQSAAIAAWTIPTAANAASGGKYSQESAVGTGVGNITTGVASGPLGSLVAFGSAFGLGYTAVTN